MSISIFLLPLALAVTLAVLFVVLLAAVYQWIRGLLLVGDVDLHVDATTLNPGEGTRLVARVVSRGTPLVARGKVVCTMFDHRARPIYESAHILASVVGHPHTFAAYMRLPPYALRTGTVGAELSNLFSPEAHRLFVSWTAELEVVPANAPDDVLVRRSITLDVPHGRVLAPDRAAMDRVILEACAAMHSDMVLNWLVHMAAADGAIADPERMFLREVLRTAHGIHDVAQADARIAVELSRKIDMDPIELRKHVPLAALRSFYRFLYAMAWRDGSLDGREHNLLIEALEKFGLDGATAHDIEREVLGGYGVY